MVWNISEVIYLGLLGVLKVGCSSPYVNIHL